VDCKTTNSIFGQINSFCTISSTSNYIVDMVVEWIAALAKSRLTALVEFVLTKIISIVKVDVSIVTSDIFVLDIGQ
jgi:hypothetical protein